MSPVDDVLVSTPYEVIAYGTALSGERSPPASNISPVLNGAPRATVM